MEDFDEAEEMNEEDLLELGDSFASINLKVRIMSINWYRTMYKRHSMSSLRRRRQGLTI